jgi:hypothetical protein
MAKRKRTIIYKTLYRKLKKSLKKNYAPENTKNRGWTHVLRKDKQAFSTCGSYHFIPDTNPVKRLLVLTVE